MHSPAQKPEHTPPIRERVPQGGDGATDHAATIAVLGGNSIVGRALELLLRGAGYEVRLLGQPGDGELGALLEGSHLLLLAPMLDADTLKKITDEIGATVSLAPLPVLALVTAPAEHPHEGGRTHQVPWPCRTADLVREIEAALPHPRFA